MQTMTRKGDCPSDLLIDQYLAEELTVTKRSAFEKHVDTCNACQALVQQRQVEVANYHKRPELPDQAAAVLTRFRHEQAVSHAEPEARRPWWRFSLLVWGPGLAVATAAALAVIVLLPRGPSHPGGGLMEGARSKGSFAISAYLKRGAALSMARSGQIFFPGDRLRFTYTTMQSGYLCIIGLDAKQTATVYFPSRGAIAQRVQKGSNKALPESTVLDDTLGSESVAGIFCPESFPIADLRKSVRQLLDAARKGDKSARKLLPKPSCQIALFEMHKKQGITP